MSAKTSSAFEGCLIGVAFTLAALGALACGFLAVLGNESDTLAVAVIAFVVIVVAAIVKLWHWWAIG